MWIVKSVKVYLLAFNGRVAAFRGKAAFIVIPKPPL